VGKAVLRTFDEVKTRDFPRLNGLTTKGEIQTRGIIDMADRPLCYWMHDLAPGAEIRLESPPVDHLAYVWTGEIEADGKRLPLDGMLLVEHNGSAAMRAGPSGARVAHFHQQEGVSKKPSRAGGNVHALAADEAFQDQVDPGIINMYQTLYVDSACPTCEIWFHKSARPNSAPQEDRHFHDSDEIIVVRRGGLVIGRRTLGPGSALAVDENVIYSHGAGPDGLDFLNFRDADPYYIKVGDNNKPIHAPICGRDLFYDKKFQHFMSTTANSPEDYAAFGLSLSPESGPPTKR